MADFTELRNMVRKGMVQSVDVEMMQARVKFEDKGGIISGSLPILTHKRHIVPTKEDKTGDKVKLEKEHTHDAFITDWLPEVGDMVICLMVPGGDGEGYILGGIK